VCRPRLGLLTGGTRHSRTFNAQPGLSNPCCARAPELDWRADSNAVETKLLLVNTAAEPQTSSFAGANTAEGLPQEPFLVIHTWLRGQSGCMWQCMSFRTRDRCFSYNARVAARRHA
jgi:hypothetical protein